MKYAFYYLRKLSQTGEVHPYACICVAQSDDGIIARGISICSPDDNFSKEIGRNRALGFATRALKSTNIQIEKRSINASQVVDNIIGFGTFSAVDTSAGKKKGKYLQSSTLVIPGPDCFGGPGSFIPLTNFEKKLIKV